MDALIGGFVATRILVDGVKLSKETIASIQGEEVDLKKYELPFEKQWELSKIETFRTWILYSIKEFNLKKRDELIRELERTFKPTYVPIMTEFKFSLGEGFDFEESFDTLVAPLVKNGFVINQNGGLSLTDKGENRIVELTRSLRYNP